MRLVCRETNAGTVRGMVSRSPTGGGKGTYHTSIEGQRGHTGFQTWGLCGVLAPWVTFQFSLEVNASLCCLKFREVCFVGECWAEGPAASLSPGRV